MVLVYHSGQLHEILWQVLEVLLHEHCEAVNHRRMGRHQKLYN